MQNISIEQLSTQRSGAARSSKSGRTSSIRIGGNFCIFFLDRISIPIPPILRPEFKSHFKADGMMFLTSSLVCTLIPKYETIKNKHIWKNRF